MHVRKTRERKAKGHTRSELVRLFWATVQKQRRKHTDGHCIQIPLLKSPKNDTLDLSVKCLMRHQVCASGKESITRWSVSGWLTSRLQEMM